MTTVQIWRYSAESYGDEEMKPRHIRALRDSLVNAA
jgi:hypothetical protein